MEITIFRIPKKKKKSLYEDRQDHGVNASQSSPISSSSHILEYNRWFYPIPFLIYVFNTVNLIILFEHVRDLIVANLKAT